jgi:hypothetical protein
MEVDQNRFHELNADFLSNFNELVERLAGQDIDTENPPEDLIAGLLELMPYDSDVEEPATDALELVYELPTFNQL